MIRNYLTTALRNFGRHKMFSFINISGLAIGIAAALVIFMIVSFEFSYEKFEKDGDRIYRVVSTMHFPDREFPLSGAPVPLAGASKRELAAIETTSHFFILPGKPVVSIKDKNGKPSTYKNEEDAAIADEQYFSLLNYKWIAGSAAAMKDPFSIVLTESRARTYFGNDLSAVIGKTVTYNDSMLFKLAGIVKDLEGPTDFIFKEFLSYPTVEHSFLKNTLSIDSWASISSISQFFLKLEPTANPVEVEKKITSLYKKNAKDAYLEITFALQPLRDIHFNPRYGNFGQRQGHKPTLYGLLVLAAFLLLLGCINFINLTTAQAAQRAKEIGVRKTLGSSRGQLIFQFFGETLLLTVFATLFALLLIPGLLTVFSGFIPEEVNFSMLKEPSVILFIIGLILTVSVFSGIYPAFFLSGYNPSVVLKNKAMGTPGKTHKAWLRKTLTVSQFIIAQFFIIATLIVTKQINYSLHKDMGFRKDAIISFSSYTDDEKKLNNRFALQQELKKIPGIELVSLGGSTPATMAFDLSTMKFFTGKKEIETTVEVKRADTNYFKVFEMKLLAGRYLQQSDSATEFLINNTYAKFLGFNNPADAVGKLIEKNNKKLPVVGVLADFNSQSTHSAIKPIAFWSATAFHYNFHVLLNRQNTTTWNETIAKIQQAYKKFYPDENFKYEFFDESIGKFYETEQKTSKLLGWATGLAIFISCLGLLGLVIYTTGVRIKEIGVRKVLGASVLQVVSLLSKDFLKLVILAVIIAAPVAWWAMYNWLEDFAYRTEISWWIFVLSGGLMIVIALLTLSIQTIRSARANPVKALRTE